mmetsp:Transcript_66571/g.206226  ORF Transcript_66571/g.206226 Transcript_66571/m.206226 type:complete len:254 (-) Transcript_66571:43-804(-)
MVVHLEDARLANAAMVAAVRLVLTTPLAMPSITGLLLLLHQVGHGVRLAGILPLGVTAGDLPGVRQDALRVADEQHGGEVVEHYELDLALDPGGDVHILPLDTNLEQGYQVQEGVDRPEARDGAKYIRDRQELQGLCEPLNVRHLQRPPNAARGAVYTSNAVTRGASAPAPGAAAAAAAAAATGVMPGPKAGEKAAYKCPTDEEVQAQLSKLSVGAEAMPKMDFGVEVPAASPPPNPAAASAPAAAAEAEEAA